MAAVLKTAVRGTVPGVRIPLPPPAKLLPYPTKLAAVEGAGFLVPNASRSDFGAGLTAFPDSSPLFVFLVARFEF